MIAKDEYLSPECSVIQLTYEACIATSAGAATSIYYDDGEYNSSWKN